MNANLINIRANDGSRHFSCIAQKVLWKELRDHLSKLTGIVITDYITDEVTEGWIDFNYRNNKFTINDQFGEYWFFVKNPNCADSILIEVVDHCLLLK